MTTTTEYFLKTNTGEYHWSIPYRAGGQAGGDGVYMYMGERVVTYTRTFSRPRRTRVFLSNVDGAPKAYASLSLSDFNRVCGKPLGSLRDIVFGAAKQESK